MKIDRCADYAMQFADQEIGGQALLLLELSNLMGAMSLTLGPDLKISKMMAELQAAASMPPARM